MGERLVICQDCEPHQVFSEASYIAHASIHTYSQEIVIKLDYLIKLLKFHMTDEETLRFHQLHDVEIG